MNRLSNACKQRDAAREEALLSSEKLAKLQEDIDSGALRPASSEPAAQPVAPPSPDGMPPLASIKYFDLGHLHPSFRPFMTCNTAPSASHDFGCRNRGCQAEACQAHGRKQSAVLLPASGSPFNMVSLL